MSENQKIRFEYDIVDNCNLNCAGCSHYAPIGKERYIDSKQAKEELDKIANIIKDDCDIIHIMGGEPLLNPDLLSILKDARHAFPNTEIQIVTNGILLADMPTEFWKICNENRIVICLTIYPIKLKVDKIKVFSSAFKVPVIQFRNGNKFSRYLLDEKGNQDINNSYEKCGLKKCPLYRNGRLYPCTIAGCVYKLNDYYNSDFNICDKDYLEINEKINKEDIYEFLNKSIPFCKYCMVDNWSSKKNQYLWNISKKEKKEWID